MFGHASIEHLGDVGVVHQRQSLAFGFEPGQDLRGVHAGFDELDGDFAFDRLLLFGHPDRPHAPFADRFHQLVAAGDDRAGLLAGQKGPSRSMPPRTG